MPISPWETDREPPPEVYVLALRAEMAELRRKLEVAIEAIVDEIERRKVELYERCLDCEMPNACNRIDGCLIAERHRNKSLDQALAVLYKELK